MKDGPVRVLVVEDEALQREALVAMCRMLLEGRPAEVAWAQDGARALETAAAFRPDIVLMDIKMPVLDGLKSARRLAAGRARPPEIIFVTAYDDFAYARDALALGAADYLLKPVSVEDLRRVLLGAFDRVVAARRRAEKTERLTRRLRAALPVLRLEVFRDLLDGTLICPGAGPAARERLALAGVTSEPSLAVFLALEPAPGDPAQAAVAEQDISRVLTRILPRRGSPAWLAGPAGPGRLGLFCHPPLDLPPDAVREWALGLAAEMRGEAERLTGRPVSAGVGDVHAEPGGLAASIREASAALRSCAQLGPGCLVHVSDIRPETSPGPYDDDLPPMEPLLEAIRLGQVDQAGALAGRLAGEMSFSARGSGSTVPPRVLGAEFVALCGRAALEGGAGSAQVRPVQEQILGWLAGASAPRPGAAEFERALAGLARDMAGLVRAAHAERQRGVVRRALAYIQARFAEPLTLEEVARAVHVSPYYLSHLLSRESGRSFTDHLTGLRMARAKELLASSDLSIGEVAARAGFSEGNYFARVFKRETGLTPSAYRRQTRPSAEDTPPGGKQA